MDINADVRAAINGFIYGIKGRERKKVLYLILSLSSLNYKVEIRLNDFNLINTRLLLENWLQQIFSAHTKHMHGLNGALYASPSSAENLYYAFNNNTFVNSFTLGNTMTLLLKMQIFTRTSLAFHFSVFQFDTLHFS